MGLGRNEQRLAGLDGIRGIAVVAITLYHLGFIDGGILSVSVFFTLSGYLITSILLATHENKGRISLKDFWIRRARRLFPALVLLLGVVLATTAIARPHKLVPYGRQALSACLYLANWFTIASGDNYFNRFGGPSPFDHLWSLAIEEQFYAVWPLLLIVFLAIGRRQGRAQLFTVTAVLAAGSALLMAFRYVPSAVNNTRAYEGTDCRAAPMLIGALTALLLPLHGVRAGRGRVLLDVLGVPALAVVVYVVLRTDEWSPFLYRGGEVVVSLGTAVLVLSAAHPRTFVGKALGFAPFRWLGERSYGVYLWHMPIVAFVPTTFMAGHPYLRGISQGVVILALAAISFSLLEDPVRKNGFVETFGLDTPVGRRWAGMMALVPVAILGLAGAPLSAPKPQELDALIEEVEHADTTKPAAKPQKNEEVAPTVATVSFAPQTLVTLCKSVIHIGDSTSLGLIAKSYIPRAEDRLEGRYRAVGVGDVIQEIAGGRAIVEKFGNKPSAWEVANAHSESHKGCWVFALGNGDSATIMGNGFGLGKRIGWMMKAANGRPVLWTTVKTLLDKGPYRQSYMDSWNHELEEACSRYPNMRVYDWAAEAQDDWYLDDKIHPNNEGAKQRADRIAKALAIAFPKDRPSPPGCFVRSAR